MDVMRPRSVRMDEPVSRPTRADQPLSILKGPTFTARLEQICHGELPIEPLEGSKYKRILIPGLTGGELHFSILGFIAQALRIRGASVTALMCDAMLPACTLRKVDHAESACTRWCHRNSPRFADAMNLPHRWYSEFISAEVMNEHQRLASNVQDDEILSVEHDGIALGHHIERSLESFFKIRSIDLNEPTIAAQARAFLLAALYMTEISRRALDELRIDKVLLDDGKKTDWGIMRAIANQKGIPVDVTNTGLRGSSVRFIVDRPPNEPSLMGGWKRWRDESLTSEQEAELDAYLTRRAKVPYEWRDEQWRLNIADEMEVRRIVGLPDEPPGLVLAMFPNVGFDAGKTKSSTAAFATAVQWIEATIAVLAHENEHHLIIKSHPSEHHRQARDRIDHVVRRRFEPLPPNVHLIAPDADVTARSVAQLADIVLTYTSTVTVEAAAIGKPVILAGGGWHAGRGIATEVHTPREYGALLEAILSGEHVPVPATELARRYAYALFFRNDIPINHFQSNDFDVAQLCLEDWSDLALGADRSLDAICRGVLLDEPFENPLTQHNALTGVGAGMSEQ